MKHINIALFVPHSGCPNQCSFCNQKSISGQSVQPTAEDVERAVVTALGDSDDICGEIAFFGGSFTAVDRDYMTELLEKAYSFVKEKKVDGIRISTRPDCIDREILTILKKYGVTAIELGCQSMNDRVLKLNRRGHDSRCVCEASALIREYGFELGHQMMTGLYGSSAGDDIETAKKIIEIHPDTVRIYPTVILENTENAERYRQGLYTPQNLEDAVTECAKLLIMFGDAGIPVIRLGLHSGGNVEEGYVAGVYHPAFRELCESEIWYRKTLEKLESTEKGDLIITVPSRYISQFCGQKKSNIEKLRNIGYSVTVKQSTELEKYEMVIERA